MTASGGRSRDADVDRVFTAIAAGRCDLGADDLALFSDLDTAGRDRVLAAWARLDAAARFAFLQTLTDAAAAAVLLDYSALCLGALEDADAAVRALAVDGLLGYEGREAIRPLVRRAVEDADAVVRTEAAMVLGDFALSAALGRLEPGDAALVVETLRSVTEDIAEEPEVRGSALASVGAVAEPWVEDLIFDALESGEPALRLGAIGAMGRTAEEVWVPTLLDLMEARDEDERAAAATAAGEIEAEDAVPALGDLLDDESLDVVLAAAAALGEIGGPEALERLEARRAHPDRDVREAVAAAIAAAGLSDDPRGLRPGPAS